MAKAVEEADYMAEQLSAGRAGNARSER
jgi:hypothetical protein